MVTAGARSGVRKPAGSKMVIADDARGPLVIVAGSNVADREQAHYLALGDL